MGFGPFSSESSASDNRQTGGDASILNRGNHNVTATPGSTLVDLSSARVSTAPTISGNKGAVTLITNDTAPITDLANTFASAVQDITGKSSQTISDLLQAQQTSSADALGKVADVSSNAATGGETDRNKIILYIVLGLLATVGAIFYFKR